MLSALLERGPLHGHALRLLAEEERVSMWTDISVGGLYSALRRLDGAGLVEVVRTEQEGQYPPRQVYDITAEGREALAEQTARTAAEVTIPTDPFDLVLARGGFDDAERIAEVLTARLERLEEWRSAMERRRAQADPYLWLSEKLSFDHRIDRVNSEIAWHRKVLEQSAAIADEERTRGSERGHRA